VTTERACAQFFFSPADAPLHRLSLLLAFVAASAGAQPAPRGERIVEAWVGAQRAAEASVRFTELATRIVDGPGQRHTIRTESIVETGRDGARRRVVYAETDHGPVAPERLDRMERRVERSLGPGAWWARSPALPALLAGPRALGPARATEHEGAPAWEVDLGPGGDVRRPATFHRGTLWFERRPGSLRLLAARFERRLPAGGHAVLDATFTRVAGLDLPLHHSAEVVVRQRRRLRWFTTVVHTEAEYRDHAVRR
jgi:hypothetical protein